MQVLYVNWESLKNFVNSRALSIQYIIVDNTYRLQAFDGVFGVDCSIPIDGNSDQLDFETNYMANGNKKFTSGGNLIVAPTLEYDLNLRNIWKGYRYVAAANSHSFFDEQVTTQLKLKGGWYCLLDDNAISTDYVEFSIVDKDDVLGYFQYFGLTVGVDVLELGKFVRTDYINPADRSQQNFVAKSASDVVQGLYFRTKYYNSGQNDVAIKITIQYLES